MKAQESCRAESSSHHENPVGTLPPSTVRDQNALPRGRGDCACPSQSQKGPKINTPAVLFRRQDVLLSKEVLSQLFINREREEKKNRVSWKGIKVQYDKLLKSNQRPKRAEK